MSVAEFGSVAEAAVLFGTREAAVRTGVRDGTIPSVRLGRVIRIPLRLILDQLEAQTAGSALVAESAPADLSNRQEGGSNAP